MKRVGLSFAISLGLFIAWWIGAGVLLGFVFVDSEEVAAILAAPSGLPQIILYYLLPFELDYDKNFALLMCLLSVGNIVLYAIPIYGILAILARLKQEPVKSTEPPPPPSFDS